MPLSASNSSAQASSADETQPKYTPTSSTILLILTFALWFIGFIGFHQFFQGNLVIIFITSLLAKIPLFQHPTSTALFLQCYSGFFSTDGYSFLIFACLLSLRRIRTALLYIVHGSYNSVIHFLFRFNFYWFTLNWILRILGPIFWEAALLIFKPAESRKKGLWLPHTYWEALYEMFLCRLLLKIEENRIQVQPGHAANQMEKGDDMQTTQVLQDRLAILHKTL